MSTPCLIHFEQIHLRLSCYNHSDGGPGAMGIALAEWSVELADEDFSQFLRRILDGCVSGADMLGDVGGPGADHGHNYEYYCVGWPIAELTVIRFDSGFGKKPNGQTVLWRGRPIDYTQAVALRVDDM